MCQNDRHNTKARCETSYDVTLKDEVWDVENEKCMQLEEILMQVTNNKERLRKVLESTKKM